MGRLDSDISNNINRILAKGAIEKNKDFYNLAFFFSRDSDAATKNVKDCVSAGLFNARKIHNVPPVKTWFYQELIAICNKRGASSGAKTPVGYKSESFIKLSSMDFQTKAAFVLYYFEDLSKERVSKVLRIREQTVKEKLGYACKELNITGKDNITEKLLFNELTAAYRSPKTPQGYVGELQNVIENERRLNKQYYNKHVRSKWIRIISGFIILAMIGYLIYSNMV